MSAAQKKLMSYIPTKQEKISIPARVNRETITRAQAAAKKLGVPLCDFIEGALKMASEDALR